MTPTQTIITVLLSFLPISELRGAIPYAVACGAELLPAALLAVCCNVLVAPVAFTFLETVHKLLYRLGWYKRLFDRFVEKARAKVRREVEKYGYLGLLVFVAIPLPVTGAWTGALGAWILGMGRKRSMLAVAGGVVVAGVIVTAVMYFGVGALSFFLKQV